MNFYLPIVECFHVSVSVLVLVNAFNNSEVLDCCIMLRQWDVTIHNIMLVL